jgi:hypothetical protein
VLYGLTLGDVPEAHAAIAVDIVLILLIVVGWWLTLGKLEECALFCSSLGEDCDREAKGDFLSVVF